MLSVYENDAIINHRPPGANSVEIRLLVCMFARDYKDLPLKAGEVKLPFIDYVADGFKKMFKLIDPILLEALVKLEIENSIKGKFITPSGDVTWKGIYFIELATGGSYGYRLPKYDNTMMAYVTTINTIQDFSGSMFGDEGEECECKERAKMNTENITPEDIVKMFKDKNKTSLKDKIKGLFKAKK